MKKLEVPQTINELKNRLALEKHDVGLLQIVCGKKSESPDALGIYEEDGLYYIYETDDRGEAVVLDKGVEKDMAIAFYNRVIREEERYLMKCESKMLFEQKKKSKLKDYKKALYIIDMNNGFVNFGDMANPEYNKLVPEQLKLINKMREEEELVNFILEGHKEDALEFNTYPVHCVIGTPEADLIPELINEQDKENTKTYYKNCINGMLNRNLQDDIKRLTKLKEIIVAGVCTDLCVFDFTRTYLRYLDEINKPVKLFVVRNATDTFDAEGHDRNEWTEMAYKFMEQAGAIIVNDFNELEEKEKELVK